MCGRWALPVLAYILGHSSVSARKLQVGRAAERQAAKDRLGSEVAALARALRSGLAAGQQPPGLLAELARERLGMEADGLGESPGGALLRAFAGRAPDSVLVMPMATQEEDEVESEIVPADELQAELPGGQGFVVVEEGEAEPTAALRLPDFVHGPVGAMPTNLGGVFKRDTVREAARHLASDMQAIQDNLGAEALESIVHEFFELHGIPEPDHFEVAQPVELPEPPRAQPQEAPARPKKSSGSKGTIAEHAAAGPQPRQRAEKLVVAEAPSAASAHAGGKHAASNKTVAPSHSAMVEKERLVVHPAAANATAETTPKPGRPAHHPAAHHEREREHEKAAAHEHEKAAEAPSVVHLAAKVAPPPVQGGPHDKTWHNATGVAFRRRCSGNKCSTRVMRRRSIR